MAAYVNRQAYSATQKILSLAIYDRNDLDNGEKLERIRKITGRRTKWSTVTGWNRKRVEAEEAQELADELAQAIAD